MCGSREWRTILTVPSDELASGGALALRLFGLRDVLVALGDVLVALGADLGAGLRTELQAAGAWGVGVLHVL